MPKILPAGYEDAIRSKLGVKVAELPNLDINQRVIVDLAESIVIKRVPMYAAITDEIDKIHLENAVLSQVCALLCPGLTRRLNIEVKTIDVAWKKDKVRWDEMAQRFLADYENALTQITTVEVISGADGILFALIKGPSATDGTGGVTG